MSNLNVLTQEQCSVIDLRGTLVRGVGNTALVTFFQMLALQFFCVGVVDAVYMI